MILNLSHIVEAIGGTLSGDETARWSGAEIDTRRDVRNKVFFALQGEQTDGHAFIDKAIEGGCAAIVVSKIVTASVPVIQTVSFFHLKLHQPIQNLQGALFELT